MQQQESEIPSQSLDTPGLDASVIDVSTSSITAPSNSEPDSSASDNLTPESNDPVVVLQLLQVKEREFRQVLKKLVVERELTKDAINDLIENVISSSSNLFGLIRVAFRGRKISQQEGAKLDCLIEFEDLLEERIQEMTEYLEFAFGLKERAKKNPDAKNILVLRNRCISIFDTEFDNSKVIESSKKCRSILKEYQAKLAAKDEELERKKNQDTKKPKKSKKQKAKLNLEERVLANS